MATRSFIAMWDEVREMYNAMYCHWDGYPNGVGVTLIHYFNQDGKVNDLIHLGGISSLKDGYEETATHENINGDPAKVFTTFNDMVSYYRGCACEYGYIYLQGKWRCYDLRPTKIDLYSLENVND